MFYFFPRGDFINLKMAVFLTNLSIELVYVSAAVINATFNYDFSIDRRMGIVVKNSLHRLLPFRLAAAAVIIFHKLHRIHHVEISVKCSRLFLNKYVTPVVGFGPEVEN